MNEQFHPPLTTNANNDPAQRKRVRTGSISGRLRTASDLEEIGMIDKYQKGYIKDLIISGDSTFQAILEKYEKGDKKELEGDRELIRSGCLGRRQSIDLLDDLDFDFLNGMKTDLDVADAFGDDFMFDFAPDASGYGHNQHNLHSHSGSVGHTSAGSHAGGFTNLKTRTASMDSTGSLSFFENLPYDANNANSLMDELQYLNRQYADPGAGQQQGYGGRHVPGHTGGGIHVKTEGGGGGSYKGNGGAQGGAPHVSFSRFVSSMGLDPAGGEGMDGTSHSGGGNMGMGMSSMLSGHKGRRDSWDIAAQYIQEEEDFSRGQGSGAGRSTGSSWAAMPSFPNSMQNDPTQQQGKGGAAGAGNTNKQSTNKKSSTKADGNGAAQAGGRNGSSNNGGVNNGVSGSSSSGNGASAQGQHRGGGVGNGPYLQQQQQGNNLLQPPGGHGQGQGQYQQSQGRPVATAGGTSTSTQHSSSSYQPQPGGASYDDIALRLGGPGFVGAYSPEQRRMRIEKFIEKRGRRVWTKKVKYDVRKNFADSRLRVKGRFVKKEDEDIMREILSI